MIEMSKEKSIRKRAEEDESGALTALTGPSSASLHGQQGCWGMKQNGSAY